MYWDDIGERKINGLEYLKEIREQVLLVEERMQAAQSTRKSYIDVRAYVVLLSIKGVVHFCKKGKLSPRYVRPYEIVEKVGPVAY